MDFIDIRVPSDILSPSGSVRRCARTVRRPDLDAEGWAGRDRGR